MGSWSAGTLGASVSNTHAQELQVTQKRVKVPGGDRN